MHGCNGKMGQVISEIVSNDETAKIVAGIDMIDNKLNEYPVFTDLNDCKVEADVIIDFTTAKAVDRLFEYAISRKLPLVLCTTGLSEEQINQISEVSKEIPVLRSANMSLGVNTLITLAKMAAQVFAKAGFDIEIVEKHHNQKVDAPSGTALAIAEAINETLNNEYEYKYARNEERKKRDKKEIGLHAVRGGTIVGEHNVYFAGIDEVVELTHVAQSKAVFANGAVEAAKYLAHQNKGLYNMENVIRDTVL
jgi:4-hydroxy-tetrahydrodipicolinate reductase